MLSERSRLALQSLAAGVGGGVRLDREALAPVLVGIHVRGEEMTAGELAAILDEVALPEAARDEAVAYIESAVHLLDTYDASVRREEASYDDDEDPDGDLPFGVLVI